MEEDSNVLITNIFKHDFPEKVDRNPELEIHLKRENNNQIYLRVSDKGIGFARDFEPRRDGKFGLQNIISPGEYPLNGNIDFQSKKGYPVNSDSRTPYTGSVYNIEGRKSTHS